MIKDWTFVVFKIEGRGLAPEVARSLQRLDSSDIPQQSAICVRAQRDGVVHDYVVAHDGQHRLQELERPSARMLSARGMHEFLVEAATRYPARHYCVCFEGHSQQIRQVTGPIHQALQQFARQYGKVDVLAFDSCFLAQAETAAEFQDVAHRLLASQEAVAGTRPVEKAPSRQQSPRALAAWFVEHQDDLTFSAMSLDHWSRIEQPMRRVGQELLKVRSPAFLAEIREAVRGAQHFYTEGIDGPHPFHNTVDLGDAIYRIRTICRGDRYRKLRSACDSVLRQLPRVVFAERHRTDLERTPFLDYTQVSRACGLSLHWPTTPEGLRDEYTRFAHGDWERRTGWDQVVQHLTSSTDPTYLATSAADYVAGQAFSTMGTRLERDSA